MRFRCLTTVLLVACGLGVVVGASGTLGGTTRRRTAPVVPPDWVKQAMSDASGPIGDKQADAYVLLDQRKVTVMPDGATDELERRVVRVLRPDGRTVARISEPFQAADPLVELQAWSIPAAGPPTHLSMKDFGEVSEFGELYSDVKFKVGGLDGVEVGTVVAEETERKGHPDLPEATWYFQRTYPVRVSQIELHLPPGWEFANAFVKHAAIPAAQGANNGLSWEARDIPGLQEQPWMPHGSALQSRMNLEFFGPGSSASLLNWNAIAKWYAGLADGRRRDSPAIAAKARALLEQRNGRFDRSAALAAYVQSSIRYVAIEIGIGGHQPHFADDIFRAGYGDCKDKATLLATMLADDGVDSRLVLVNTNRGSVEADAPGVQFDHAIIAIDWPTGDAAPGKVDSLVTANGHQYLIFDPTDPYTPFGEIPWYLQGNTVLITGNDGGALVTLPEMPASANLVGRTAHLQMDAAGSLSGDVEIRLEGIPAARERARLKDMDAAQRDPEYKGLLSARYELAQFGAPQIEGLESIDKPLVLRYQVTSRPYVQHAGNLSLLQPEVFASKPFSTGDPPRQFPFEFDYTKLTNDDVTITLPQGMTVESLTPREDASLGFARFHSKTEMQGRDLHLTRSFQIDESRVPAARASEVANYNQRLVTGERQTVVLKQTQP